MIMTQSKLTNKKILDPCCGSKMMWFDKNSPDVLYCDNRRISEILCDGRKLDIDPEMYLDFRNMPFDDESFYLVVFDPPHLNKLGKKSWMAKKYGVLEQSWPDDIKKGFEECWRVLKPNGTLIFKWNETQISKKEILSVIPEKPLFGHTSGRHQKTIWMTFFKNYDPNN